MTERATEHDRWTRVRWTPGDERGHVESYFLKANDPKSRRAFWLKFTLLSPKGRASEAVAEVWAIVFNANGGLHVGGKQTFAAAGATIESEPLRLRFGESALDPGRTSGSVRGPGGKVTWDLTFSTDSGPFVPLPRASMYEGPLPRSKFVTPYPDARFSGHIEVNGARLTIDSWPGILGHNWQREHAARYAWAQCNLFDDAPAGTFFEGVSARLRVGPILTPWLTMMHLQVGGEAFPFNGLRTILAHAEIGYYRWAFETGSKGRTLRGEIASERDDMVGLLYVNPDGPPTYCLNSKIAKIELRLLRPGRPPMTLRSRAAALELGVPDPNHGIRMLA